MAEEKDKTNEGQEQEAPQTEGGPGESSPEDGPKELQRLPESERSKALPQSARDAVDARHRKLEPYKGPTKLPLQKGGLKSYVTQALNKKILVGGLLFTWPLFIILMIIFGGLWAAAISGFFGERAGQPSERDDPERVSTIERMNATERTLGIPTGPVQPPGGPCDFVVPDALDRRFLNEGFTFTRSAIGAPEGTHIEPDDYMITTMDYLCGRHSRIAISHIISVYVNMRLDPEEQASRDPQIIANISAHNRGQAYDVVQIDYVYKVFRHPCPPSPNWTIEYWSDEPRLLLAIPCREPINRVNTTFAGGPATAIPIQVIWQDQPAQFAPGGLPFNISTGLSVLSSYLGLSPEALRFASGSLPNMLSQVGQTYLEELLGLSAGSLQGNDLPSILQSAFGTRVSGLLGQLPRPSWGTTVLDWTRSTGAGWWERTIGLFPGSFQGWNNPPELFRSVGLETAANILRIPSSVLRDPAQAAAYLRSLSQNDLGAISRLGTLEGGAAWGPSLVPIVNALQSGDEGVLNAALEAYGADILEIAFSAPPRSFRPCQEGGDIVDRPCPDPYAGIGATADRTGVDAETLRGFVGLVLSGGNFAGVFGERGAPLLETAFTLPSGSLAALLSSPNGTCQSVSDELRARCTSLQDQVTIQNLATRLGIDTSLAQQMLTQFTQGQQLLSSLQQVGSTLLGSSFQLSDPLALFQIATGTAPTELRQRIEQELRNLAQTLNLPPELVQLQRLFSGNFADLGTVFSQLGSLQIGEIFGLSVNGIQQLLSGNLSVLLNLPAFQGLAQSILNAFGLNIDGLTGLLTGNPLLGQLASIGNVLNGLFSALGLDQMLVMERVYRPEARRKVHLVLRELLDMPFTLDDIDLRVTQLITYSHERDVQPFEDDGTLNRVYGVNRSRNFGLFSMREAFDHLHIAY